MIIVYMMIPWFLILLFSNKNYSWCAIIILLSSLSNILIVDILQLTEPMTYIEERGFLIKLDGLNAVILTAFYLKDKLALKMSFLLAFSVLCHTMINLHLIAESSFVSTAFYAWYDELIITIGILQMAISRDGITSALRNIREFILWVSFYTWCFSKSFASHQKSEGAS